MSDLHNPWGESVELDFSTLTRLRGIFATWGLSDAEAAFVLQVRPETWALLREGAPCPLDAETRMRVRHCLDVSAAIQAFEPGADEGEWLRRDNPMLGGRSPMHFLVIEEEALRSIRFTLMMDAYPGFPDRTDATSKAGNPRSGRLQRWRFLLPRWRRR